MCTDNAGRDTVAGWIEQCNILNKMLEECYSTTARIIGTLPTTEDRVDIKEHERCLADTLGCTLNHAIDAVRGLNAQLNRIADKF